MTVLAARLLIAALFLVAGVRKILFFSLQVAYFTRLGFPLPEVFSVLAILVEVGGAALLITGWRTREAAWLLIAFTLVATFMAHRFWEFDPALRANQMNHSQELRHHRRALMLVALTRALRGGQARMSASSSGAEVEHPSAWDRHAHPPSPPTQGRADALGWRAT
jgi:putative oxidoreductase